MYYFHLIVIQISRLKFCGEFLQSELLYGKLSNLPMIKLFPFFNNIVTLKNIDIIIRVINVVTFF
jgi:hypothetical protein